MDEKNPRNAQSETSWEVEQAKTLSTNSAALVDFWNLRYDELYGTLLEEIGEFGRHGVIAEYINRLSKVGNVLDVGCGTGILSDLLNRESFRYEGIDVSEHAIDIAQRLRNQRNASFKCTRLEDYSAETQFEAIVFNEVLYYLDVSEAINRSAKLLSETGLILISVYDFKEGREALKLAQGRLIVVAETEIINPIANHHWRVVVGRHRAESS